MNWWKAENRYNRVGNKVWFFSHLLLFLHYQSVNCHNYFSKLYWNKLMWQIINFEQRNSTIQFVLNYSNFKGSTFQTERLFWAMLWTMSLISCLRSWSEGFSFLDMRDIALFRLTMASRNVGFGAMWALVFHSLTVYATNRDWRYQRLELMRKLTRILWITQCLQYCLDSWLFIVAYREWFTSPAFYLWRSANTATRVTTKFGYLY